jgi:hypothetical protein
MGAYVVGFCMESREHENSIVRTCYYASLFSVAPVAMDTIEEEQWTCRYEGELESRGERSAGWHCMCNAPDELAK